jgi:Fic family protein
MALTWIWQQPGWPRFRWDAERLQPLLDQARQAREQLLERIRALETPLAQEAVSALLGRESLGTAAIESEQLDPGQVPAVSC